MNVQRICHVSKKDMTTEHAMQSSLCIFITLYLYVPSPEEKMTHIYIR